MDIMMWLAFAGLVTGLLIFDFRVLNRKPHAIETKEAFWTSLFWIGISLVFNAFVFYVRGTQSGFEFLTGYLIEKALSVDNIFVFVVLFSFFGVARKYQHRVLYLGILGAMILRGTLIALGTALVHHFDWIIYVFGLFLIYTAYRLATDSEVNVEPDKNIFVHLFRRLFPVSSQYHEEKFFTRIDGRWLATPLFITLIVIETTDLIFALDSIPAIFAITIDPFIIYSSNVFAILGLRALYFLLAGVLGTFKYLKAGLSFVLVFVGTKMLIGAVGIEIPILVSLGVIAIVLTIAITASMIAQRREAQQQLILP